ncbi:helix-turn-helix domain-containing protein [Flavobacterium psychrophilum]|nr:helix-turn-helix domain-containing protein [Flavobacterium psychrophilum]EKT3963756.1 helix-turn-helix domain-containing protein [Flavobacterium psychrophilum]EKT3966689.1 helix-turn-helix domain-containing protein [Flavobacterium psychrophilum]EKT4517225.1 helix-turn-helix domain-containing protein [Flavobacterium psychrophilum]ELV7524248.1 helix-turn-helix domain-containing protein [Flavobacterium psychrophilum]MBF2024619.1 helix-turn-helix domain-containing protein [Flavobacterium psychr
MNNIIDDLKTKEFLTVKDVSVVLSCSRQMVNKLINTGKLKAFNFGIRITRVKRSDLDEFTK